MLDTHCGILQQGVLYTDMTSTLILNIPIDKKNITL